jgi:dienelactone hydrolase
MAARAWPGWPTIEHGMGVYRFAGRDGVELACRETGSGRPLVLLHGFMGAGLHMLDYGWGSALAEQGYRVIAPDLRGHGDSAHPHDPAAYPPDVLADDGLARPPLQSSPPRSPRSSPNADAGAAQTLA